jgi:hypothetical protein
MNPILNVLLVGAMLWSGSKAANPALDPGSQDSGSRSPGSRSPVLVELFTSEGCSSCPPADALLRELDQKQPVAGSTAIVLSEHVDYWNRIGWNDPFSSAFFSDRQKAYAARFGLSSVYTPQMVVDGSTEFTGSEWDRAQSAIGKAGENSKLAVSLASLTIDHSNQLRASVEVNGAVRTRGAEVFVALALDRAESQVSRGENAGRKLSHVGVVKKLEKIGEFRAEEKFTKEVNFKMDPATSGKFRLVVFVQEPGMGRVLGAAEQSIAVP